MADDLRVQFALDDLDSPEIEARLAAITTLGEAGDKAVVPRLLAMLRDDDPQVRTTADSALRKIGGLTIVQGVLDLLRDDTLPDKTAVISLGEGILTSFARDVHDGLAAKLAAAVMQLTIIERLLTRDPERVASEVTELKQLASQASQEARNIITNLKH